MASTYLQPMSRRRRATALGLTVALHVLVALIVWNLPPDSSSDPRPTR